MEFAKLSNVIAIRGYQPNDNYQAYPRFIDSTPKVFGLFGANYDTTVSNANYAQNDAVSIAKASLATNSATGLTASSLTAAALVYLAIDQLL